VGLLTGLVGMAVGGGVVWAIRIVAGGAMGVEALGFGDVTLMAMVGAFLGWQAAVMGFFLAPFAAIFIVLVYLVITRESRVPFGPYLCAGSLLTILMWDSVMNDWFLPNFAVLGPFVLWLFIALTGIMGVMLFVWRIIKESYFRE
jgi:prepilin signal peptidase PulO-like enzyme (type II secretory pathway)